MSRHIPRPRNRMDTTPRTPWEQALEPLLIRLLEGIGVLPEGFIYEIPAFEAHRLIARRKAVAVGSAGVMADLSLSQDELEKAGIG